MRKSENEYGPPATTKKAGIEKQMKMCESEAACLCFASNTAKDSVIQCVLYTVYSAYELSIYTQLTVMIEEGRLRLIAFHCVCAPHARRVAKNWRIGK